MAVLTAEERGTLPDSAFAVPHKRLLPIHDLEHARLAWSQVDRTEGLTDEERREAKRRILAALRAFGVDISGFDTRGLEGRQEARGTSWPASPWSPSADIQCPVSVFSEVREGRVVDPAKREVEVTIIRPGTSENGLRYPEDVLAESVPLWQGISAFVDHPTAVDLTRAGGRSVRDLVGVYANPRYDGGIKATLRFLPAAEWLYRVIEASIREREAERPTPNIGISADMVVRKVKDGPHWDVLKVVAVNSADIVFRPSAGGRFERILEGKELLEMEERFKEMTMEEDIQVDEKRDAASVAEVELVRIQEARRAVCQELLEVKLGSSALPPAATQRLRQAFSGRIFEASELEIAISDMRGLLGEVMKSQVVRGMGTPRPQTTTGKTPLEKIQMAVERLFGLEVTDPSVPRLSGIREAYILITGDKHLTGAYNWEESVVREANEVTTAVLDKVVGIAMTKRLVMDYKAQVRWWEPIVRRMAIKDMKQQQRILLYDFSSLSTVSENTAYTNLAWDDIQETYTPAKRGNLVQVTLETIINDDLQAVLRIPQKLAIAATVTINEFVANLFIQNGGLGPLMADGFNVFDPTNHQGNKGTAALDATALQNAIIAMGKYNNTAGKRLGVKPQYLLVPVDLFWTALTLVNSTLVPGVANNDVNVLKGIVDVIVVPQYTDTNNWYLMANPNVIEGIELGFLNGQETPELIVQDQPYSGSVFSQDVLSWKVRWIFGGGWLDYRAAYASIVA